MVPRLSSQIPHALHGPVQSKQKHICNAALASLVKASMLFYLKRLCYIKTTMSNWVRMSHSYSSSPNRHSLQGQHSVISPGFLPLTHTGDSPSNHPSHVYHSQASIKDQQCPTVCSQQVADTSTPAATVCRGHVTSHEAYCSQ